MPSTRAVARWEPRSRWHSSAHSRHSAQAVEFSSGDWNGTIDTTLSYGASMRLQERDPELIGLANINPLVAATPITDQINAPGRFSVNSDDGNLNYDKNDLFSNAFKITTEFSLNYKENWGAFARASYFYDWENADRSNLTEEAKEKVGTRLTLLDAFVFHNMDLNGHEASIRVGRQAVSWGESTFIQNGINVINPIDVSKLRVAGAELKEAFLPVDMIQGSISINENLSFEALYLLEFEQTEPDPAGTYFSTNDFATLGADFVMIGFGRADEPLNFANCGNVLRYIPANTTNINDALERHRLAVATNQFRFVIKSVKLAACATAKYDQHVLCARCEMRQTRRIRMTRINDRADGVLPGNIRA